MSNATDLWGQDIHRQAIPRESTGDWLDVHAAQVDETRKPATKTHGKVLFLRGDVSGNVRIPAGRILRTKPDGTGTVYRYVTEALAVLPDGADSVAVSVVAEEYGQSSNAAPGQICELVTPVEGVRGVVVWHKPSARPMMGEFRRDSEFHSVRFQRLAAQSHAQMLSRRHQMPSEHGGKSPYYRKNLAAVARAYGNREARRDRA